MIFASFNSLKKNVAAPSPKGQGGLKAPPKLRRRVSQRSRLAGSGRNHRNASSPTPASRPAGKVVNSGARSLRCVRRRSDLRRYWRHLRMGAARGRQATRNFRIYANSAVGSGASASRCNALNAEFHSPQIGNWRSSIKRPRASSSFSLAPISDDEVTRCKTVSSSL